MNNNNVILIVDDTPMNIRILSEMLKDEYDIRIANNGQKALDIANSEQKPDLILLDIMMPDLDGYEVCRRLKNNPETSSIPIIFITAKNEIEDEVRGFSLGAVDYIIKPFNVQIAKARIRTHLHLRKQAQLLEEFAFIDPLTQIPNRRQFEQKLDEEWRRAVRNKSPLSICMLDIDYFKQYNDSLGHGEGDVCLQKVAQSIHSATARAGDLAARYGGEEFVVIFPNSTLKDTKLLAEKICKNIESLKILHPNSSVGKYVTISIGCATIDLPSQKDVPLMLVDNADKALYKAKEEGRNRVCTYEEEKNS